jgi:acyl carrier protein
LDARAAITAIRQAVARDRDLQLHAVVLIEKGSIPKTSSGKIQRRACRAAFEARELDVVYDWNAGRDDGPDDARPELTAPKDGDPRARIEADLTTHVAELLELDVSEVEPTWPLHAVGIDSLAALNLKERIEAKFGVSLPLESLIEDLSTADVAALLVALPQDSGAIASSRGLSLREQLTPSTAARLLARVDAMSDDEVDALLDQVVHPSG